jgi:hypothetical protein
MVLCGLPSSPALLCSRNLPSNSNHRSWVLPPSPQHLQCLLRLPYHHILRFLHCCLLVHVLSVSCNCGDASIISHLTRSCSSSVASNIAHSAALPSSTRAFLFTLHNDLFALVLILDDSSQQLTLHRPTSTRNSQKAINSLTNALFLHKRYIH